jgi:hypothetical protein
MATLPNVEDITEFRIKELCGAVKRLTKGKCRYDRGRGNPMRLRWNSPRTT